MYLSCRCTYPRRTYAEDQPPDPFRRRISVLPFLSLLASSFPFLFFLPSSSFFSSPLVVRPVAACTTIHLSSRFLVHDGKTRDRVGNNVPGKKPRRERRIFSSCLLSLARAHFSPPLARRIPPFYFACLCKEKGLARGELSCRIQRDDRWDGKGNRGGKGEMKRGRTREMERDDNPFGGHNAELGTVKLTRQEIRPTNRPLSLRFPPFLSVSFRGPRSVSRFLLALLPRATNLLPSGYMQTAIVPSGPVINLLNYIMRTRCPSVHPSFFSSLFPRCSSLVRLFSISSFFLLINRAASRNKANNVL